MHQPKRRGRKRKYQMGTEEGSPQAAYDTQLTPVEDKSHASIPGSGEIRKRQTRTQRVKEIEARGAKIDAYMESRALRERIHASLMKKRYGNYYEREEGLDQRYRDIYAKIKSGVSNSSDLARWTDVISKGMAKSMCKIMEFFLQNGPMTRIETNIFDNCTRLLKSYYLERVTLIQKTTSNKYHYLSTTYYPEMSTSVYALLVGSGEIPSKNELGTLNK